MSPTLVLADSQINTDLVTPGVLGFLVVAFVGFVLYLLMKSMLGKLSTVRGQDFEGDGEGESDSDRDTGHNSR